MRPCRCAVTPTTSRVRTAGESRGGAAGGSDGRVCRRHSQTHIGVKDVSIVPIRSVPAPQGAPARLDRAKCRSVRFYGEKLHLALTAAADYLQALERQHGCDPHVVCLHDEYSWEDANTQFAWQVTLVVSEVDDDC